VHDCGKEVGSTSSGDESTLGTLLGTSAVAVGATSDLCVGGCKKREEDDCQAAACPERRGPNRRQLPSQARSRATSATAMSASLVGRGRPGPVYRVCVQVFECLHNMPLGARILSRLFCYSVSIVPGRRHLRSAVRRELDYSGIHLGQAFAYACPTIWNTLPNDL